MAIKNKYIAIAGGIAVGKSTLITCMSNHFAIAVENTNSNPYLIEGGTCVNSEFHSQMHFLSHRFLSQLQLSQSEIALVERTIFEDAEIFAKYFHAHGDINNRQWTQYMGVYRAYCNIIKHPDLIIFVDSNLELSKHLIKQRGRASEVGIGDEFLRDILQLYRQWIDLVDYCPVLRLHTEDIIGKDYSFDLNIKIKKSVPGITEIR